MRKFEKYIGEEFAVISPERVKNNVYEGARLSSWCKKGINGVEVVLEQKNYLKRRAGCYLTFEILEYNEQVKRDLIDVMTKGLVKLIKFRPERVLVLGVGNEHIISDSLGPRVIEDIDIFKIMSNSKGRQVAKFSPSVLAVSGLESFDVCKAISKLFNPDLIIVVDSLCAGKIERLGRSFQLSDAGIVPGSAVGSKVCELNEESMGVKVISVGVPMVVYLNTLLKQLFDIIKPSQTNFGRVLESNLKFFDGIFSPKDIDFLLQFATEAIGDAITRVIESI